MLKIILIVGVVLCAASFAVRAEECRPAHHKSDLVTMNPAGSSFHELTPSEMGLIAERFGALPPGTQSVTMGHMPDGDVTYLFTIDEDGCLGTKAVLPDAEFKRTIDGSWKAPT